MLAHLRACIWLLVLTVLICSVAYPAALLGIGQTVFKDKANGSLIVGPDGKVVGSRLIAQLFTSAEYFQPRPSAASYNAAASGATNWGANNYLLRDRVARQLGPIAKYAAADKKGQLVGKDVEAWFQKDRFGGQPGIVARWAQAHGGLAAAWVKADKLNTEHVEAWQKANPADVAAWVKDNPGTPEPTAADLAVPFFVSYAKAHPGTFPSVVVSKNADGKEEKRIEPLKESNDNQSDIQSIFFDMWRQEHPKVELQPVPADLVMASGCGLDPHITLDNALYQLNRVAAKWAEKTKRDEAALKAEITALLQGEAAAPLAGLAGVKIVNVLEVNLALAKKYGAAGAQ